ncbi:hypothetical protein [Clostridium gasigenes]|uniref:hypothetical protein n=1 Tax=Clostridium gasigenes TaxID=94869 RepID=UPI001C0B90DD|nr:hypothetical protein [Clostridium gasigenes]MBU3109344.1 hypothetical protein [Clostridium gasigenes]
MYSVTTELILYRERKAKIIDNKLEIEALKDGNTLRSVSYEERVQESRGKIENDCLLEKEAKLLKEIRWIERKLEKIDKIIDLVLDDREKEIIEMTCKQKLSSSYVEVRFNLTYHQIRNIKIRALNKLEPYFIVKKNSTII